MSWEKDIRKEFAQLEVTARGRRIVYLDSAATTLKPRVVVEAVAQHLKLGAANVHRGAHWLSDQATNQFEQVREQVRAFLGAATTDEIVFTKGTTDGLNLLAHGLGATRIQPGDEILLTQMEHHSNIVPWQLMAKARSAKVRFVPILGDGTLDLDAYAKMLSAKTKVVSVVHVSNALGTLNPVKEIFQKARAVGATCVLDAAQSIANLPFHVADLDCDFLVFSGHKLFGPTGVGVLYGKLKELEALPPYQGGGSMIQEVTEAETTFLAPPHRFEAGTPAIAEVIGLGAAISFIDGIDRKKMAEHKKQLRAYLVDKVQAVDGLKIFGPTDQCIGGPILAFRLGNHHHSDVGSLLDQQGIAIRAGHHCCQPLMRALGVPGTARVSFSVYNNQEDMDLFVAALKKTQELLA